MVEVAAEESAAHGVVLEVALLIAPTVIHPDGPRPGTPDVSRRVDVPLQCTFTHSVCVCL